MLTHVIDAPLPKPNSTIVLYYYSKDFPRVKLLVHSSQIIANFELPIGIYTEEAGEARHKDSKYIRGHHTRKMSRTLTIADQFNYLLVTSDPIISSFSFQKTKKKRKLSLKMLQK
jgi:hypothetical protein